MTRRRKPSKRPPRVAEETRELVIETLGARGDGIASDPAGPIYVPDTAPGDRIEARVGAPKGGRGDGGQGDGGQGDGGQGDGGRSDRGRAGRLAKLLAPGPDRVTPPCRHADACGGCAVQHLSDAAVAAFKRGVLVDALRRKGVPTDPVRETRSVPPRTRRRITLAARRVASGAILGFNERAGSRIIDLAECRVASPGLEGLIPSLRRLIGSLTCLAAADVLVTETDTGIDLLIAPADGATPSLPEREALADFAVNHDLARLSWRADGFLEPLAARRAPRVAFGGVMVEIPIGAFLQPSAEGQAILTELMAAGVPAGAKRVADLYTGCGAFALPLAAAGRQVHAAEGDEAAVASLRRAAAGLRLTAEVRDLARDPLSSDALSVFDAVIFDPPRAGAAAQAAQIAASAVPAVVAVSCNPATLARDLRALLDGGYALERVTPVDQFTWSAHVEAVAILRRS